MNAIADSIPLGRARLRIAERHVMVASAALFVVVTLAGFIPSSLSKVAAVQAGERAPFPLILHVHAALMGAWLLLLLAQSLLASSGRRAMHRALGLAGAIAVPAILISGVLLTDVTWKGLWDPAAAAAMPAEVLLETRDFVSNLLLLQGRALFAFALFIGWALLLRRRDPAAHLRLMILGTAVPVLAGIDRLTMAIGWTTMPASPLALDFYLIASVLPLLAWDFARHGKLHRVTWVWLAVNLALGVITNALWGSDWWLQTAPRLIGVA